MKTFFIVIAVVMVVAFIIWSYFLFQHMRRIDFYTRYQMDEHERQCRQNQSERKRASRKKLI